jgi:hypothetical protein
MPVWFGTIRELSMECVWRVCAKMPELYGCCGKFYWPNGELADCDVTWEPAS